MTLQLTDRQAQILAACALCHRPLDWRAVKPALESGEVLPPDIYCARCGVRSRAGVPADEAIKAAFRIIERVEAAGLYKHSQGIAADAGYPPRGTAA
jgi:hypothetical protein